MGLATFGRRPPVPLRPRLLIIARAGSTRLGTASVAACLIAVAVVEVLRRTGALQAADLAATPAAIAAGRLWLLLTSAFAVSGPPVLELFALGIASTLLVVRRGAAMFWTVALVGHIGATLVAYAGVGALWVTDRGQVEGVVDRLDYGVSAVLLGALGALFADSLERLGRRSGSRFDRLVLAASLASALIGFMFFGLLAGSEHLLAFLLGALIVRLWPRKAAIARAAI